MNRLEKFFTTINTSQSSAMKRFATEELISQIKEYADHTLYVLRHVYKLLVSSNGDERVCGAEILKSVMFQFKLGVSFSLECKETNEIYLSSTGEEFMSSNLSINEQTRLIKKKLQMEHVDTKFLSENDFKIETEQLFKKKKVQEKSIENIFDFFAVISSDLLSYEWHRRHGAFIAFYAIFSSECSGETLITLDSHLITKIFEIFKTDKFNDFVNDKVVAPVREAAAKLLGLLYTKILEDNSEKRFLMEQCIQNELLLLLDNSDWQTQFSGLIALGHITQHVIHKDLLCTKLIELLQSVDEDIKFLSADLLCEFVGFYDKQKVMNLCWSNIEIDEDIALSKTSILSLITKLSENVDKEKLRLIYPCFTSPVPEVRESVLKMVSNIEDESLNFLIAENILLEEKDEIRKLSIDMLLSRDVPKNLILHFYKIISRSLYEPYIEEEFVSYDDTFFTFNGVKAVGRDKILRNRCLLFGCIMGLSELQKESFAIGETFHAINNQIIDFMKKKGEKAFPLAVSNEHENVDCSKKKVACEAEKPDKEDEDAETGIINKSILEKFCKIESSDLRELELYHSSLSDVQKAPLKELRKKLQDVKAAILHPYTEPLFTDYVRFRASQSLHCVTKYTKLFFELETCSEFVELISKLLTYFYDQKLVDLYDLIVFGYTNVVELHKQKIMAMEALGFKDSNSHKVSSDGKNVETERRENNFLTFFRIFGTRIFFHPLVCKIMGDLDRQLFYAETIKFYLGNNLNLDSIFYEALETRNKDVLKGFVTDIKYAQLFTIWILNLSVPFEVKSSVFCNRKHKDKDIRMRGPSYVCRDEILEIAQAVAPTIPEPIHVSLDAKFPLGSKDKLCTGIDVSLLHEILPECNHSLYPLFVKPLLDEMHNFKNQKFASRLFSHIIPHLTFKTSHDVDPSIRQLIDLARVDIESLLNPESIKEYEIKCPIDFHLRDYQIQGIKWLSFLYSYNVNGILADDMGLGKTIQVLSFICSEIYNTNKTALVICPSSLTGHWKAEIERFFPHTPSLIYKRHAKKFTGIVIVSYDMFRNDYISFVNRDWFYVISDEGHVLRNKHTVLYSRMYEFKCKRRLILTGTPVNNSIDDLVALFNWLMPNYLGSEKEYSFNKSSDSEIQKAKWKLELLHKKVLPFVLRRLKLDVLKDLPPKIIRDMIVEFGPVQEGLYRSLENGMGNDGGIITDESSQCSVRTTVEGSCDTHTTTEECRDDIASDATGKVSSVKDGKYEMVDEKCQGTLTYGKLNKVHVFKRTKNLLQAASHIGHFMQSSETSCKIKALEDIITLCGGEEIRNKILIFFQFKSTIDLVIKDIAKKYNFKYARIDGSVPSVNRNKIAMDFNTGTTPIMFLTTQVGGLGLNLTGADTVVFYEHDWNPFNDLQAMDRAHRIGQSKTVNVFRLIAKNSIEEKVMNLQAFKVFVASSLVSQQNADIETMDTKDLLERFKV